MLKKIVIVGGHGNIAIRLARLLVSSPNHSVVSIIRNPDHAQDLPPKAKPLVLSIEDAPISDFANAFESASVIVFAAGAGGKGGSERTKAVDYEGAVKVFDAIEAVKSTPKPRLILVSAIDVRPLDKIPSHYNEKDLETSKRNHQAIGTYMKWKFEADKALSRRTAFEWFIIRPGSLTDDPGTGRVSIGRTHLGPVTRDDVAQTLALLVDRNDWSGLALDLVGGDTPIQDALDGAIRKGETDLVL